MTVTVTTWWWWWLWLMWKCLVKSFFRSYGLSLCPCSEFKYIYTQSKCVFCECRKKLTPFNISSEKECEKKPKDKSRKNLEAFGHFYKAIIAPKIKNCVKKSKKAQWACFCYRCDKKMQCLVSSWKMELANIYPTKDYPFAHNESELCRTRPKKSFP